MNHPFLAVQQMNKMLGNMEGWLDKATTFAKEKNGFDANVLLTLRLAPDQYELVKQIQSACDSAKFAAARLSRKEPPKHPDTETTMEQIRARIAEVRKYLSGFKESDFANADDVIVPLPWMPGKAAKGSVYLHEMSSTNFYFHLVHTYAILRNAGVNLGKMDFMGQSPLLDAKDVL